jgi:hypothetical protein
MLFDLREEYVKMKKFVGLVVTMILVAGGPHHLCGDVWAEGNHWETTIRGGANINSVDESFNQADIGLNHSLPWGWQLGETLAVDTGLTTTIGVLDAGGDTGILGSLGFELIFGSFSGASPMTIRAGSAVTMLSEHEYGDEDLGGVVQFTHHLSLHYQLFEHLSAMARVQHMSNADLYDENPGLDMLMLGVVYRF